MKQTLTLAAVCILSSMLLVPQAEAADPGGPMTQCPIAANPLIVLTGPWTFKLDGLNFGAAGRFVATVGSDPRSNQPGLLLGLLSFVVTSNNNGTVLRQEVNTAKYQINFDCTGGSLSLVLGSHPITLDFWFTDGFNKIYMVSTGNLQTSSFVIGTGTGLVVTGIATRSVSTRDAKLLKLPTRSGPGIEVLQAGSQRSARAVIASGVLRREGLHSADLTASLTVA